MPSEAQIEAGNYAMDHIRVQGLPITIENRKGTVRKGKSQDGTPWSVVMPYEYGFIRRTLGADGEHVDCFVGPNKNSQFVVVVNQHHRRTGVFEEIKVGLGYSNLQQAKAAYRLSYRGSNVPAATFVPTTIQRLKEWLKVKQTWAAFDFRARVKGLTHLESNMKRLVQFRQEEEKPSIARRIASIAAPAAIIGGTLAYRHINRSRIPTAAVHPSSPPRGSWGAAAPESRHQVGSGRSSEWLTGSEAKGLVPRPKKSIFYKKPAPLGPKAVQAIAPVIPINPGKPGTRKLILTATKIRSIELSVGAKKVFRLVEFQPQNDAFNHMYGASDRVMTAYRTGRRIVPWVKRGSQVANDSADIASGKKVTDPFYKKGWFKAGAVGAAIGAPILAARKINAWHHQDIAHPNSIAAMSPRTGALKETVLKAARKLDDKWVGKKVGRAALLTGEHPFFAAKIKKPILLQAVVRHLQNFDFTSDQRGWDLRDARGKSARVYAPGSKRRDRRDKSWGEQTDNIRLVRNVAIGGTLAGAAGVGILAHKASVANAAVTTAEKTGRDRVVAGIKKGIAKGRIKIVSPGGHVPGPGILPFIKHAGAKVRTIDFRRRDSSISKIGSAIGNNVDLMPDRPEIPGEDAAKFIYNLPPKPRAGVLRILGAGAIAGTGIVAGKKYKRPLTGAALGGLGAGLWINKG